MKQQADSKPQILTPHIISAIILTAIFCVSLFIRVLLPYKQVFVGDSVRFLEVDPWWYMRLMDNLAHNFPHLIPFDPYFVYPNGGGSLAFPGFAYILGTVIWLAGLGSPTQGTINTVAAYFPAVLGALLTIPAYFIGKEIFNRWVGILSAALVAILPGPFLNRTLLGFTDHHIVEIFFTTLTIMFLVLAVRKASHNQISFANVQRKDGGKMATPLIYSLLAGASLGVYLVSWVGGLLFIAIIILYLILQFIIDHLRHNSTDYLCITGTLTLLTAGAMVFPLYLVKFAHVYEASLLIAIAVPIILGAISHIMANRVKAVYYPLVLVGLGTVSLSALYLTNPSLLNSLVAHTRPLISAGELGMVQEMQPLLFQFGHFSLGLAWNYFTTSLFISLLSFGFIAYSVGKENAPEKLLLLVWYGVLLVMTLIANRFAYYLAISVALLTGYISWKAFEFAGFRKTDAAKAKIPEKREKQTTKHEPKRSSITNRLKMTLSAIIIFFLVFIPNLSPTITLAADPGRIYDAWYDSLLWLKGNTPEPFDDPSYYYQLYEAPPPGEIYVPPQSAYGVLSRRDAGYWITRIAHRIPNHNSGGQNETVALFFASQDEVSANQIIENLGARYIIIDYPLITGLFLGSVAIFAGKELSYFFDVYYERERDGIYRSVTLYHPEYYRCIAVRLYNFDCQAVTPTNSTFVISYEEKVDSQGKVRKVITSSELFPTYDDARAYVAKQGNNYRIVGINPFISPVPLEELKHYRLIHGSEQEMPTHGKENTPFVKIFEFTKNLPKLDKPESKSL